MGHREKLTGINRISHVNQTKIYSIDEKENSSSLRQMFSQF